MAAGISTRNRATMKKSSLLLKVESLCGATGYPLRTPRLEDTVLDAHTCEPIPVITERYWAFYASVDGLSLGTIKTWHISLLKSAWRNHTRCSVQICHKIDINNYRVL